MSRLPILCLLLIIAVYANAISYSDEVEVANELLKNLDSPESIEDGFLDDEMNNLYKQNYYKKHSREHDDSYETNSRESWNRPPFLDDATVLPHEKFCKYFYKFDNFEASLLSCSRGYRFDAEKLQCLRTRQVNCGKRKKDVDSSEENKGRINFKCPKWNGVHPHEYYCNLYYSCQNYKRGRLFMCPPGMLFEEHFKRCVDRKNVHCNKRIDPNGNEEPPTIRPEVFVCPSSSGKYPHERDCSAFYRCNNKKYTVQYCSKGKLYNERKKNCESEHKVTCGSRIHPDQDPDEPEDRVVDPNPNYNCREDFGRHNHDRYCNWYYQCHDRRPSVRECRRGWRYHSHGRRCRVSHEVTCDGKPDHEDSTTEEITTASISTEPETTTPTPTEQETTTPTPTEPETTTPTPTEPETTPTEPESTTPTPTEPEITTPTEPETTTPTPTEPETPTPTEPETPTPTEPETTTTQTEPETTTPTPTEPETTTPTPTPTEPETTTPSPTEPETTTPTPTEPETTTPTPTEPEITTPTPTEPETTTSTTTEEPTTTKRPKVTAPDTDCAEDDADCIIEDLGITPDWFICPEDIGSYPHPSSRKLFIFCLNWKPSVKKCGQDLLYSEDLRTCEHA